MLRSPTFEECDWMKEEDLTWGSEEEEVLCVHTETLGVLGHLTCAKDIPACMLIPLRMEHLCGSGIFM